MDGGTRVTAMAAEIAPSYRPDLASLAVRYAHLSGRALLRVFLGPPQPARVALVSSFGTEAALLLALVAQIDPTVPVIFIDTGKLFGETLRYHDDLIPPLGLRHVPTIMPDPRPPTAPDPPCTLCLGD